MSRKNLMIRAALAGLTGSALLTANVAPAANIVQCAEQERCYGVAKAGKNDCATAVSACAGTAKQDDQKDAWVYVPKGSCAKLGGGTLTGPVAKR